MYRVPDESKQLQKKAKHNEMEKRRIKTMSNLIDEMRTILSVWKLEVNVIFRKLELNIRMIRFQPLKLLASI